jgi:hypothetical protein
MKHIKKHPINDKAQKLSKDMKKQELVKPKTDKKLDADKSLSDPDVSMRVSKPSNKKLDGEKFLSEELEFDENNQMDRVNNELISRQDKLKNKLLDEVYELLKLRIKSSDVENFQQAEDMIHKYAAKYLNDKLWNDEELSNWMEKKEFGE